MSGHICQQDTIYHMETGTFSVGCWECLYGTSIWPVWADNITVSPAKRVLMESVKARGIEVDTDGTDTIAFINDHWVSVWSVATEEEITAYDRSK
jgi:hypothetical protein